jgi:hypothetical protein
MSSLSLTPVPVLQSNAAVYDVPYFNVKDTPYTAKGDGATADDVAIQAAITACSAAGGGTVLLPPGTYILNAPLTITSALVRIRGENATLKLGSGFVRGSQGQGHIFINGVNDVSIENVRFDGNSGVVSADATNNFAVWITNGQRVTISNCYVTGINSGGSNINTALVWAGTSHYAKAIGNTIENASGGGTFMQGQESIVVGNSLNTLNDVGIVFNGTNARDCTATGNTVVTIPAQCAFGVENGASEWVIVGNTIRGCFGALDINDASYSGPQVAGGLFTGNEVVDLDKGASSQVATVGVFHRTAWTRNIKIVNNIFTGLTPYGTNDSFVFVSTTSEGLEIRNNVFESKAQVLPGAIVFVNATHTRCVIDGNSIRSNSSVTKLSRGIWLQASGSLSNVTISNNQFENITNYAVHFDTSVTFTGSLKDNISISGVGALYQASPWGTFAPGVVVTPHELRNFGGRSRWNASAFPAAGTWISGDIVNNFGPSGSVAGWICTAGGTPGTWRALSPKGNVSTQTPGAVTTVTIAHGLGVAPTVYSVQPGNANARGAPAFFVTVDATNITLTFASALTAATSYTWAWLAG